MGPSTDRTTRTTTDGAVRPAPAGGHVDAMPVVTVLAGPHATSVRRFLEAVVGWQAVDERTASLVPPRLTVADVAGAGAVDRQLPLLLLVSRDDDPGHAAGAAVTADAVVRWPEERDRLPALGAKAAGAGADVDTDDVREVRVGGACGGVGTTTIALSIAGIAAWRRVRTLVLTHGAVPAPGGRAIEPVDLLGAGVWEAAAPAPGVRGLRILRLRTPVPEVPVDAGPAELVVRDLGVDEETDVLVVRRDRAGLEAAARSRAAVVVVTDVGPASRRSLATALQGRRTVVVPWSSRVARAGAVAAVPARLPGAWLRRLAPVLGGRP